MPSTSTRNAGQALRDRFDFLVDKTEECWIWTGAQNKQGYGVFTTYLRDFPQLGRQKITWQANRLALVLATGQQPPPLMQAMHSCNNPPCVNPAHLSWGTKGKNTRDAIRDGLWRPQRGENRANAKLNDDKVREIRRRYDAGGVSQQALADEFGVTQYRISLIVRRKVWSHVS